MEDDGTLYKLLQLIYTNIVKQTLCQYIWNPVDNRKISEEKPKLVYAIYVCVYLWSITIHIDI